MNASAAFGYISALFRRVNAMVGIGRISIVDDTGNVQKAQVNLGVNQIVDLVRVLHDFGFTSNPPANTDAVVVFACGDRSKGVALGTNNQTLRPKNLESGGAMIYDANGNFVKLTTAGIEVHANNLPVVVDGATNVQINATALIELLAPEVTTGTDIFTAGNGVTGSFTTEDGKTVTVRRGIITAIT